ncbi:MAG: hypothetical protein Q9162_007054 [Coniocarpon cinnabarinum]
MDPSASNTSPASKTIQAASLLSTYLSDDKPSDPIRARSRKEPFPPAIPLRKAQTTMTESTFDVFAYSDTYNLLMQFYPIDTHPQLNALIGAVAWEWESAERAGAPAAHIDKASFEAAFISMAYLHLRKLTFLEADLEDKLQSLGKTLQKYA